MSDSAVQVDHESQEFAEHLGKLLTTTRRTERRSIRDMAAEPDAPFSATRLRQLERGSLRLDEDLIDAACQVYGADLGAILPNRKPLSIKGGVIKAGGVRIDFVAGDPTSLLTAYLRLIRAMRDQKKTPAIALRRDDIEELARSLGVSGEEVVDRLASLMGATSAQRTALRALFATGAIVIGLAAAGAVSSPGVAAAQASSVVVAAPTPAALTGSNTEATMTISVAKGAALLPALRLTAPAQTEAVAPDAASASAPPTVTLPGVVNKSNCLSDPATQVMRVVIPSISYDCPVYAGGQAQIDSGLVTLVTGGADKRLATQPGDPGTIWLAAHRSVHGGAFSAVPSLADGALITVATGANIVTYRVVARAYVQVRNGLVVDGNGQATEAATLDSVFRADRNPTNAPRLVLQTCDGANFRWMIYADLVSG
jgi:LPXTG-site transpeptidase (sortase) family protein